MMMNLYLTADKVGIETGGGIVTANEYEAIKSIGNVRLLSRDQLGELTDPWGWDENAAYKVECGEYDLCHVYAGTFGKTIKKLKSQGCKVVQTIAAHCRFISRREHEKYCGQFPYPHLKEEDLWTRYIEGYRRADCIVSPSKASSDHIRKYGQCKEPVVIPHGCNIPEKYVEPPTRFTVGYLGAYGLDKGVIYLLEAWKKLAYRDSMLVLAGRDMQTASQLYIQFGGGGVWFAGWQKNVSDFYNKISLYVQPSATEGFGIEILEAMAHGRAVIGTDQNCALDMGVPFVPSCDSTKLAEMIDDAKKRWDLKRNGQDNRERAKAYTWDKVREQYIQLWRKLA